jgi:hypothetical protein
MTDIHAERRTFVRTAGGALGATAGADAQTSPAPRKRVAIGLATITATIGNALQEPRHIPFVFLGADCLLGLSNRPQSALVNLTPKRPPSIPWLAETRPRPFP